MVGMMGSAWSRFLGGAFALVLVVDSSLAQSFDPPSWAIGDPLTTYQEWNFFTNASTAPDVGLSNPNGSPSFTQTGGFITGGGNVYSFSGDYAATVVVPNFDLGAGYETLIIFQIEKSLGPNEETIADPTIDGMGANTVETLFQGVVDGFVGPATLGVYKHTFVLAGNDASYTIQIPASIHSSLQAIRVDTQAVVVPEASSLVLLGAAGLMIGCIEIASRTAPRRNPTRS
jgi:hypothetical protein